MRKTIVTLTAIFAILMLASLACDTGGGGGGGAVVQTVSKNESDIRNMRAEIDTLTQENNALRATVEADSVLLAAMQDHVYTVESMIPPHVDINSVEARVAGTAATLIQAEIQKIDQRITELEGKYHDLESTVRDTDEAIVKNYDAVHLSALLELKQTMKDLQKAYTDALNKLPPVPPNILFAQAPRPRPDAEWVFAFEPRLTASRNGYGRISFTNISDGDRDTVVSLSRLNIERHGTIHGYVHSEFPSQRYWASMAIAVRYIGGDNQSKEVEGGIFFMPQVPPGGAHKCQDVAIFVSRGGEPWEYVTNGCEPQLAINGDYVVAVAVDVQYGD